MKYWQKMLEMWQPLQTEELGATDDPEFFEDDDEAAFDIMDAFMDGFDVALDMSLADIVSALEDTLASTKMKKKYRRGFMDAANMVYEVFDRYAEDVPKAPAKTVSPYWTAQMSYGVYDDYSVVKEWDSFGRNA